MKTIKYNGKTYNVFPLETEFGNYEVILTEEEYQLGGLAVEILDAEDFEPFASLTTCLGPMDTDGSAFVDTNNCPWAQKFLKENKLAKKTGVQMSSGYCIYPLYEFHTEKFYAPKK